MIYNVVDNSDTEITGMSVGSEAPGLEIGTVNFTHLNLFNRVNC